MFYAVLILMAMTAAVYFAIGRYERDRLTAAYSARMVGSAALRSEILSVQINRIKSDVRFLSGIQTIIGLTRTISNHGVDPQGHTTTALWKQRLQSTFTEFAVENPDLAQLRFIGVADNGRELVRVQRSDGRVVVVPDDQLQDKAGRDYFQNAIRLNAGQVSVSAITLNREHGEIERPFVPTVRSATPVFAPDGTLFGIVVINLDLHDLFAKLRANSSAEFQIYLINDHGDYLMHPDTTRTFGFDLGERWRWQDEFILQDRHPEKQSALQDFVTQDGLVHAVMQLVELDPTDASHNVSVIVSLPDAVIAEGIATARFNALLVMLVASLLTSGVVYFYQRQRNRVSEKQAELAAIVESSRDAIIGKTLTGIVTSWNHGAELMFGYTAKEAIGRELASLIVPAEFLAQEADILQRIGQGINISAFNATRHCKDGRLIEVSVTVSPIRSADGRVIGAAKTVRDNSAQKAFEKQIRAMNKSLEQQVADRTAQIRDFAALQRVILEYAGFAMIATDTNGLITLFNPAAERMMGYQSSQMIGKHTPMFWRDPVEIAARAAELSAELGEYVEAGFSGLVSKSLRGLTNEYECTFIRKDGGRVPVLLTTTALRDESGAVFGFLGIAADLTERREVMKSLEIHVASLKSMQLTLEQVNDELQIRTAEAEKANHAKSEFLANMSHEIRTPMNAILGMLQLLQQTSLDHRQVDYAHKAETAARALLGLLNDILDFSRVEAGKLTLDPHPFNLIHVLRDVGVILTAGAANKNVAMQFELDPAMPEWVQGDAMRLQQVLVNLIGNAIKFTERGAVVLETKLVMQTESSISIYFAVRDTGIGISAEQSMRIFEGFSQAEASTARRYGGSGLGLAISQRLVQLMGGSLDMESEVGRGSKFYFTIEFQGVAVADRPAVAPLSGQGSASQRRLAGLRLLVVDDNSTNQQVAYELLSNEGALVLVADGGRAAIDAIAAANPQFDAVLMDVQMPDMDGYAATAEIRQNLQWFALPVIAVTANVMESDRLRASAAGMTDHVGKPFDLGQLVTVILRHTRGGAR